ncbi:MAG: hypothetical protein ACYDAC_08385 [Candidatus Dormibacteria bacterium]
MPFFKRHKPVVADFAHPVGTLPCMEAGCASHTALTCAYRDRRGHGCAGAFCPQHWTDVGGVVYCRRHAGTITALGLGMEAGALPDIDNRGPSLVSWIANEISDRVAEILAAAAAPGESVAVEPHVVVIYDQNRNRRWERSWKLIEPTGVTLKVSAQVAENDGDDALVDVRVGSNVIARGVPPWIARRRAGQTVDAEVDAAQRDLFRRFFLDHIATEVARQRNQTALAP